MLDDSPYEPVASTSQLPFTSVSHEERKRKSAPTPGAFESLAEDEYGRKPKPLKVSKPAPAKKAALPVAPVFEARTLDYTQQVIAPDDEPFFKSAVDSGVFADALARSRRKWLSGGVLRKFSSNGKGPQQQQQQQIVQPPHNLSALGKFEVRVGPHIFTDTTMWEVRWKSTAVTASPKQSGSASSDKGRAAPATKTVSPALIAELSQMSRSDPALAEILRVVAAGTATSAQIQSMHRYVATLEQRKATQSSTSAAPPAASPPARAQYDPMGYAKPAAAPPSNKSASPVLASAPSLPAVPLAQSASPTSPGSRVAPSPGDGQQSSTRTQQTSKNAVHAAPPSLIVEFRENPGERWILPDLYEVTEVSAPPDGELRLVFYAEVASGSNARVKAISPPQGVKCTWQLCSLSHFSFDALIEVGKTVPQAKRRSAWDQYELAQPPRVFLQPRLPHAVDSAYYAAAVEDRRIEELKRKGVAAPALRPNLPAAAPAQKKKPTSKTRVMSALKAPKGKKKDKPVMRPRREVSSMSAARSTPATDTPPEPPSSAEPMEDVQH